MFAQLFSTADRAPQLDAVARPRLAVVVMPFGQASRFGLRQWLASHYGIEQLQSLTIPDVEWAGLAGDAPNPHAADRLRERLALALLARPALIVVFADPGVETIRGTRPRLKRDVERIVQRIRSWDVPAEVIGAWMQESRAADESQIVSKRHEDNTRPDISILSGRVCPQWLAEAAWENEGGSVGLWRGRSAIKEHRTNRQAQRAVPSRRFSNTRSRPFSPSMAT